MKEILQLRISVTRDERAKYPNFGDLPQPCQTRTMARIFNAMAPLRNVKHEAFCREVIKAAKNGRGQGEAYLASGYKADGHGADVCASRLLKNVHVQARIAELSEPAAKKTRISVESLLAQLEATVAGATEAKQFGAVNGSLALMAS